MSILYEAVEPLQQLLPTINRCDSDGIDRLNQKFTTLIFILLAVITATNQYFVGETIKCWSPAEFPDSWVEYANSICWSKNTYYIPMAELNILDADRKEIVYYQWVPIVLFLQALMFFLPCLFWNFLSRSTGMDINKIVRLVYTGDYVNIDSRDDAIKSVAKHIDRALRYSKPIVTHACSGFKAKLESFGLLCGKRSGNHLVAMYLFAKLLYVGNVVLQLYMLNHFLGTDYTMFGVQVMSNVVQTGIFKESRHFPRVTLCDFEVRALGRHRPYTVQCTLPINLFNEKIFIFVWFWLVFILLLDIYSIITWCWTIFTTNRRRYVKRYLKIFHKDYKTILDRNKSRLFEFSERYLRQDGHFVLRMIAHNTNEVVVGELIDKLWEVKYPDVSDLTSEKQSNVTRLTIAHEK